MYTIIISSHCGKLRSQVTVWNLFDHAMINAMINKRVKKILQWLREWMYACCDIIWSQIAWVWNSSWNKLPHTIVFVVKINILYYYVPWQNVERLCRCYQLWKGKASWSGPDEFMNEIMINIHNASSGETYLWIWKWK